MASVPFTAPCDRCPNDARWVQRFTVGVLNIAVTDYEVTCKTCDAPLPTTPLTPVGLPPATPLMLKGYRWVRTAVGA